MIRPSEDLALYRAEMASWPGRGELRDWQAATATGSSQRRLPPGHPRPARHFGPLTSRDLPGHLPGAVVVVGWNNNRNVMQLLEPDGPAGRGRRGRAERRRAAVGSGQTASTRTTRWFRPTKRSAQEREAAAAARHRPRPRTRLLGRARTWRRRGTGRGRGRQGHLAGRSLAGSASPSRGRAALLSRSTGSSTTANGSTSYSSSTTSWRCTSRRPSAGGVLRAAHPLRRPAGREARRHRRPQGGCAPDHAIHQDVPFTKTMSTAIDDDGQDMAHWLELELAP